MVIRSRAFVLLAVTATVLTATPSSAQPVAGAWSPSTCPGAPRGIHRYAPGSGKTVALTFDDGPGRSTKHILRILANAHVEATFFNLGMNEAAMPGRVRAEHAMGYALGDHTWDHTDLSSLDATAQAREIDRERREQASLTGEQSCLLRPPYGTYDATTLDLAQQRGMRVWNWSVDTEDWKANGSADPYWVHRIISRAEAGGTQQHPVILMHNQTGGNPATVAALPAVIKYRTRGYSFVNLFGHTGQPVINRITPSSGPLRGHIRVTITGYGFQRVRAVRFGTVYGRSIDVESNRRLIVLTPPHAEGRVHIRVITTFGRSSPGAADAFRYIRETTAP
jgi:peptidoglycan/xylan/chitin deacetylase (PgdA/CDA1 family)